MSIGSRCRTLWWEVASSLVVSLAVSVASLAGAQVSGTDCACTLTGAYVLSDPGVRPVQPDANGLSPHGDFRVVIVQAAPLIRQIVRVADDAVVLDGISTPQLGFSPDDGRAVAWSLTEFALYELSQGPTSQPIWSYPRSLTSFRLRFSDDGRVFLFAGLHDVTQMELYLVDVASRATYQSSFSFAIPPADPDDDVDVAGWGFGPDPTRFVYGYTRGQSQTSWVLVNVHNGESRQNDITAQAMVPWFSPCGDVYAEQVQPLFSTDSVNVALYSTLHPNTSLGVQRFPVLDPTLRADADFQAGAYTSVAGPVEVQMAPNTAGDSCAANAPPIASFDPPVSPIVGQAAAFTDTSTDPDGDVAAWSWDFGDGGTSSQRNPSHVFAAAGTYTVRLTVTDNDGDTDFVELDVHVCGAIGSLPGKLLFSGPGNQGFDLYAIDTLTLGTARITNSSVNTFSPTGLGFGARYSPDGTQIAFVPIGYLDSGIWVMSADGSGRRRLTDGSGLGDFESHLFPAWSPDGQWLAFTDVTVALAGGDPGLYLVRADGSGLVKIPGTQAADWPDFRPVIASACVALAPAERTPGCYTIAFRGQGTSPSYGRIYSIRGDGSELTPLVGDGFYATPRFSPDGLRLAYSGAGGIFAIDLDANGAPVGTADRLSAGSHRDPVWSPDGSQLAFSNDVVVGSTITAVETWVTDSLGCQSQALLAAPGAFHRPFDWKPGSVTQALGSLMGFVRLRTGITVQDPIQPVAGAIVEISGDVTATTTTAADGSYEFANLPIGGSFSVRFVSAPGIGMPSPPYQLTGLVGGSGDLNFYGVPDHVRLHGRVTFVGAGLAGVTMHIVGPGGPFTAVTDANGDWTASVLWRETYTLTPELAGYRFEPATQSIPTFSDFEAIAQTFVASLPPPAGRIAFTSTRDGDEEIYLADLDGGNLVNLTANPAADRDPAWSPEGARIAFASDRDGAIALYVMGADGSNVTPLGVEGREPAWSPESTQLAFATDQGIRNLSLADGTVSVVTSDPTDASPSWHRDGLPILGFERQVGPGNQDWYEIDLTDPNAPLEIPFSTEAGFDGDPAYRPGGDGYAYSTDYPFPGGTRYVYAWIPSIASSRALLPGGNPSWSPDGERIVADDGNGNLLWTDKTGSGIGGFVTRSGSDRDPDWRPDVGAVCDNGLDDDGDGLVDTADPGCVDAQDASEREPGGPVCDDGEDQDFDGLVDYPADSGCTGPSDASEVDDCNDGIDNDGDGMIDYFGDPDCSDWTDPSERVDCANGLDDDGDRYVDAADPGCADPLDRTETGILPGCDNGGDDDGDGLVDLADPGCPFPHAPLEDPICDNGLDDDGDGLTDAADPTCQRSWPYWEAPPSCGIGAELAWVFAALGFLARRARGALG